MEQLLESRSVNEISWRHVVESMCPRGNASTFYSVTGRRSRHPLIGGYARQEYADALYLAWYYGRSDAVAQLVDEAKVWTYWPYREAWLARCGAGPRPEDGTGPLALISTVTDWARAHTRLAVALDCAPPVCAVEDLLIMHDGRLSPRAAIATLVDVVRSATGAQVGMASG
ncbi:hypothetical protein [Luedemannella helvata]|uniref:hypothetical protein n=1 Tax=Luedemannella helvata TaxID=349315 RepID=UPI0031E06AA7